jgi:diaminohydroxyphosphoribosylaminopyrimidine deaminase / 5-amino-6-(5-phosphoribosylamino)uracil reductase
MLHENDISLLHQAAKLAIDGHGTVEPNPMVGCIITNPDGFIVGEGYHERYGEEHAEIHALHMAGDEAKGGTAYVTLEPCDHHGKTPPCSKALVDAGIKRVVIGARDPHEEASGGAHYLESNGIVIDIVDDEFCKEIIEPFSYRIRTGLPWVTCKWAQTIDGCIETPAGDSPWISCKESQQLVHEERGCVDAIVVGVGTVVADNPSLTVRGAISFRTPIRVVVDPTLRTPRTSNVLNDDAPTLIAHEESANTASFQELALVPLPSKNRTMDLAPLFRHLVEKHDATNVIVEGGATVFRHIFEQGLANELWVFTSPHKATITPTCNMNTLVKSLHTTLIDEQPCGIDVVRRFAVN